MPETKQLMESVTISLDRYTRLKEIEEKYFKTDKNALQQENEELKKEVARLNNVCEDLAQNEADIWQAYTIAALANLSCKASDIPSTFGYIKRKNLQNYIDELILTDYSEFNKDIKFNDKIETYCLEYIEPSEDIKLCKNETQVDDNEYYKLQQHLNAVVYNFLKKHNIPEGYTINYSIDNLPELAKEGITTPACDGYLGIMDANNNEIVASM